MNVISSFPAPPPPNLTFRTLHPGALQPPPLQSKMSSAIHPEAAPFPPPAPEPLFLSVWNTLSGFVLRTSHTTRTPSCDATANFRPSAENAVENDAAKDEGYENSALSGAGMLSDRMGVNDRRAPPAIWCTYTLEESPTDRSVRPSGDMEANEKPQSGKTLSSETRARTVVHRDVQPQVPHVLQAPFRLRADGDVVELDGAVVVADPDARLGAALVRAREAERGEQDRVVDGAVHLRVVLPHDSAAVPRPQRGVVRQVDLRLLAAGGEERVVGPVDGERRERVGREGQLGEGPWRLDGERGVNT